MCDPNNIYQEFVIRDHEVKNYKHRFLRRLDEYYNKQAKNELTALKNKPKEIFDQKQAKQEELSALTKFNSSNGDEPTLIDDNAKTDIVINDSTKPDISVDDNSQDHPRCSMTYFHIDWY